MSTSTHDRIDKGDERDAHHTSREIGRQPGTWRRTWRELRDREEELGHFLREPLSRPNVQIVLTGAGSSAFAGEVAAADWQRATGRTARAIPTTDLVTHARELLLADSPLLLISLARSGNSPESMAAVDRAERYCARVHHLAITCNPDGRLADLRDRRNAHVHLLPAESEDRSLAMTNSFSSLSLAAALLPMLLEGRQEEAGEAVTRMSEAGEQMLKNGREVCRELGSSRFRRAVFLGSGSLQAVARESHLKVQELTNGRVVGKFDSFLGFRHGPKAVIDGSTLLVYLLSNRRAVRRYESDLVRQVAGHGVPVTTLGVTGTGEDDGPMDHRISVEIAGRLPECLWAILSVLPAQMIGYFSSVELGLNPDDPSPEGTISRVVEGVTIYEESSEPPHRS